MTAFDSVARGTAGDSDAGDTSNEHGRTGRCEQDGSNVASVTYWKYAGCACTGEACYEQIEAALAAVVAKNTGHLCERCVKGCVYEECFSRWTATQT